MSIGPVITGIHNESDRRLVLRSHRWIHRAVLACLAAATLSALAPVTVSAEPCDGSSCVPHVKTDVVAGGSCTALRLYALGLDANGNTFICYATHRNPKTATWSPLPPLVGVRDFGALCDGPGVAQSPDGLPLVCRDSIRDKYTTALPVS